MNAPDTRPAKIHAHHLDRWAVVYVRQSSPQQVLRHTESAKVQANLHQQALQWGWPAERIRVIDQDQGRTATTVAGRDGFRELLAEISLEHVGLVLGLQMSRLAREDEAWCRLMKLCGVYHTLLADLDGLYDPHDPNDHLLLGLKGLMSQAELHQIQQRMHAGRLSKARRGELFSHPPMGYLRDPQGGLALDPDEQVQHAVRTLFAEYERQGSVNGLLKWLVAQGQHLPIRSQRRERRGELEWHEPNRRTLLNVLQHPVYAGAYTYGRQVVDAKRQVAGRRSTGRQSVAPEDCAVFLADACPAYISWEQYEANRRRLAENRQRADALGSPRSGPSWLSGLVVCGHCGARMVVCYSRSRYLRYICLRQAADYGKPVCQNLSGACLEALVAEQILQAVEPAALELSFAAAAECERQRGEIDRGWQLRLERARHEVERAERQYQRVEPENRLVARTLERQWEERLQALQNLEEEYARTQRQQPRTLTTAERDEIAALSSSLPALWHAEQTRPQDRQEIARLLLRRVIVMAARESQRVEVCLVWSGDRQTTHTMIRPVARYAQLDEYDALMNRIKELRIEGHSSATIAERLNAEGFRPPRQRRTFNAAGVRQLFSRLGQGPRPEGDLGENEWLITDLAAALAISERTLHTWIHRAWIQARRSPVRAAPWIVWADADEIVRLKRLRDIPRDRRHEREVAELKKPKDRQDQPAHDL
jgi:DNA invertase Pin-like site-specific DNA recombinase